MSEEIDCFVPNERPDRNTRAPARRWSDDPWCNMTTGEADAWRCGFETARTMAVLYARRVKLPEDCGPAEAHGRMAGSLDAAEAIAAMEPPEDRRPPA